MRNLKKILALVLALMMALSVMVFASAKDLEDYTDAAEVSEDYTEAVDVLTGMGIFEGDEEGFRPQDNITRAEVATLVYRVLTADVTNAGVGKYVDYGYFDDVPSDEWYAGYVNYVANGKHVVGTAEGIFAPDDNVTGYEMLTIMLRTIGYGQKGEFEGDEWTIHVAQVAGQLGITQGLNTTLGADLTREEVAYVIFQAIQKPQVTFTPAFGYETDDVLGNINPSVGYENFTLAKTGTKTIDNWGRPGYEWTYTTGNKMTVIAETPTATYTTSVTECDIAAAVGFSGTVRYDTYVNGVLAANVGKYDVVATDVVTKLGAQGRLTEVYGKDRIVMIDTMLAQVTNVTNYKADAAGHVYSPATLTLEVFDSNTQALTGGTPVVLQSYTSNYSYSVGQMLLVNTYTNANNTALGGHGTAVNTNSKYVEILGTAQSFTGSQTVIHYNDGQHTVNGTTYNDAGCFHLDQAQKTTTNHTWYLDQYNNLIGATDIAAVYTYGTIKNIQWVNPVGSNGYAQATLVLMDGSEVSKTVIGLNGNGLTYSTPGVAVGTVVNGKYIISTSMAENNVITGDGLYQISETAAGVSLTWVNTATVNATVTDSGRVLNASITNKQAYVTGDKATVGTVTDSGNDISVITDEATQYLVRSGVQGAYVYTPVTGVNNISSYRNATVDYVDVDNDGRAEYVYFWGTAVNSVYTGLFYPTTLNYREVLQANGVNVDYYVMTGYVDGNTTVSELIIPAANVTALNNILAGGANQLYTVNFVGGNATAATKVNGAVWIDQVNGKYSNPDHAAYYANVTTANKALYQNGVLTVGGLSFYVTDATKVFGNLTAGTYDDHDIYVVYTDAGAQHYATELYVADKPTAGNIGTVIPSTAGTVVYNLTMYMPNGTTQYRTHSVTVNPAAGGTTYNNQNLASVVAAYWPDITLANWNILIDNSTVTVDQGQTVALNYAITWKNS